MILKVILGLGLVLLLTPATSARGVFWPGEFQKVENGSVVTRTPAKLSTRGRRLRGYLCTPQQGSPILFKEAECTRRGSHLLCARSTPKKVRGWTGLVCWGDIYLKR